MPIGFLTTAERDRLNRFPVPIPDDDLVAFFQLSEADHTAINQQREDHTRLGFAMQLCALRYLALYQQSCYQLQSSPAGVQHSNSDK
jgi:TnpA family transposase